ncbi:unnamed protein product [Didymodactylos carnosus]|uniref:Uncharacterized protein n=1 Tax=Didymodactylos carnosus TaxID=1234261 RepID=A0A815C1X2_9BILA|nr:unnamed protein product [Didymodactylos carnosus]CAF1279367.1 unnamed protein product [Didymodactylos carnosus]CAF3858863.1 unnamed protein product [Didymodactylos carnosus]CAF4073374.1 unnamed protein product [Didymodactylos carnosus]
MAVSAFYLACGNGEIDEVREYLKTQTVFEVNKIEPNGSTALHAAAHNNQRDVVQLLLETGGASRSIQNNHQLTAYEDAQSDEVKKLFARSPAGHSARFVNEPHMWEKINNRALNVYFSQPTAHSHAPDRYETSKAKNEIKHRTAPTDNQF